MSRKNGREIVLRSGLSEGDRELAGLSTFLVRTELAWVGHQLLKLLKRKWRHRRVRAEHATTATKRLPKGPFKTTRPREAGDLLLWVPRGIDSYLIDHLTGGYGYSHATVDTGEIDEPTKRPVMAEITVGQTVTHKFQDQYGLRAYVRVPLSHAGVDVRQFVACVESKMGEHYDMLDALTLGEIEDPAKEVCSGLVAGCLPEEELRTIAMAKRLGLLQKGSISIHSKLEAIKVRAFVSPNGLAEYYGAPKGNKVHEPNMRVEPNPASKSVKRAATLATKHQGWKVAAGALAALAFGLVISRRR